DQIIGFVETSSRCLGGHRIAQFRFQEVEEPGVEGLDGGEDHRCNGLENGRGKSRGLVQGAGGPWLRKGGSHGSLAGGYRSESQSKAGSPTAIGRGTLGFLRCSFHSGGGERSVETDTTKDKVPETGGSPVDRQYL